MNIAIYYRGPIDYIHKDPDSYPLPGTETAVLRMSAALLDLGNTVTIMTHPDMLTDNNTFDVCIVKRNPIIPLLYPHVARRIYFWSPDLTSELSFLPLYSCSIRRQFIDRIEKIICISDFQRRQLERIGIPSKKLYVSRNGVKTELFKQKIAKDPLHCIYVSTHSDGLAYLPFIWREVKKCVPAATLTVIAARSLYGTPLSKAIQQQVLRIKALPGVTYQTPLSQKQLARALLRSAVYLYPNTYPATSSILTLEARAAGCIIVTSSLGAMPESAQGNYFISGHPSFIRSRQQYAHTVVDILRHYNKRQSIVRLNRQSAPMYDWSTIASEWDRMFHSLLKKR